MDLRYLIKTIKYWRFCILEEISDQEIKHIIRRYLDMEKEISCLQYRKATYSDYYYKTHSIVGSARAGDITDDNYQIAIPVENMVILIVLEEQALQRRIDRLIERNRLFKQVLGDLNLSKLEHGLRGNDLTLIECKAYDAIKEVTYYVDSHRKACEQTEAVENVQRDKKFQVAEHSLFKRLGVVLNEESNN